MTPFVQSWVSGTYIPVPHPSRMTSIQAGLSIASDEYVKIHSKCIEATTITAVV